MNFRQNDIIFLLGAGASVEAGVPTSFRMMEEVELLLQKDDEWKEYKKLYDFVKSSIYYGDGINGQFGTKFMVQLIGLKMITVYLHIQMKQVIFQLMNLKLFLVLTTNSSI